MAGIRAELEIRNPGSCPVAGATAGAEGTAHSVDRTRGDPPVVEQFQFEGEGCDAEPMFESGTEGVYRVSRSTDECVCDVIESLNCPVSDVWAEDGTLYVALYLDSRETLKAVLDRLRADFAGVGVRQLTRADAGDDADLVTVDRGRLTDRQREVLATAYELGYFEHPRGASGTEVADRLGIVPSTFNEHLSAAQSKLFGELVDADN